MDSSNSEACCAERQGSRCTALCPGIGKPLAISQVADEHFTGTLCSMTEHLVLPAGGQARQSSAWPEA